MHIDIDPTSISKTVAADIPIVGDAKQVLRQMLELLETVEDTQDPDALKDWWLSIQQWRSRKCLDFDRSGEKIKPQAAIEVLYRLTKGEIC